MARLGLQRHRGRENWHLLSDWLKFGVSWDLQILVLVTYVKNKGPGGRGKAVLLLWF